MTFKPSVLAAALALGLSLNAPVHAQPAPAAGEGELARIRTAVATDKRAFVASMLALTDDEAKRFWPIYEDYQRNLDTTIRRTSRLVEEIVALDRGLTDANAKRLANELVAIDEEEARDRRRMHNRVMRALPPTKALRYLQIENKARAIRVHDVAAAIPLVK